MVMVPLSLGKDPDLNAKNIPQSVNSGASRIIKLELYSPKDLPDTRYALDHRSSDGVAAAGAGLTGSG